MTDQMLYFGVVWLFTVINVSRGTSLRGTSTEQGTCEFGGRTYTLGDTWHPYLLPTGLDRCTTCTCAGHGHVNCHRDECPAVDCPHTRLLPGQCCPVCVDEAYTQPPMADEPEYPGCVYKGKTLRHGDLFSVDDLFTSRRRDQCVQCGCTVGRIYCALKTCLPLPCSEHQQVVLADSCCPVCVYDHDDDNSEPETELDPDPASNGLGSLDPDSNIVMLENEVPIVNELPSVPLAGFDVGAGNTGESASHLECESNGATYEHGAAWHPVLSVFGRMDCILCRCLDGETSCSRLMCTPDSQLPCTNPHHVPGQCCKVCPDSSGPDPTPPPSLCLRGRETTLLYRFQPELVERSDGAQTFMYALEHLPTNHVEIRQWQFIDGAITSFQIEELSSSRFERAQGENREGRFQLVGATSLRKVEKLRKKETRLERRCTARCVKQALKLPRVLGVRHVDRSRDCDVRTRWLTRPIPEDME